MDKNWKDIQELLGDTKSLKIQLVPNDSGYAIRLVGDKGTRTFNVKEGSSGIDVFDIKFQVQKNKKSPFRYHLPSVSLDLSSLEETVE